MMMMVMMNYYFTYRGVFRLSVGLGLRISNVLIKIKWHGDMDVMVRGGVSGESSGPPQKFV